MLGMEHSERQQMQFRHNAHEEQAAYAGRLPRFVQRVVMPSHQR
jgi:hypothetical protein